MAELGLALTDVLLNLGNIGTGIGFDVAEKNKMDELNSKASKLKADVTTTLNFYNKTYYVVSVNLKRVKKGIDMLPSDLLSKVEKNITSNIPASQAQQAVNILAGVFGYSKTSTEVASALLELVSHIRNRKIEGEQPVEPTEEPPFEDVPVKPGKQSSTTEVESSFPKTPMLTRIITGINIAGAVFGIAGLATTIGLGVWTIEKLNKALQDLEGIQKQVSAFQKAMEVALDQLATAGGLPTKSYDQLKTAADTWKTIAESCDAYAKVFYYAIQGYYAGKSDKETRALVAENSDVCTTLPDDAYPLAKTIAEKIKRLIEDKMTDKEIVKYFTDSVPISGQRFALSEFFVSTLRKI